MANEKLFHVGVKALITNSAGKILVLNVNPAQFHNPNDPGHWDIPGGRIQEGGNVIETLQREIEEETAVAKLESMEFLTSVVSNIEIPISDTQKVGLVLMVYRVVIAEDSRIIISEENLEYEWVDPAVAAERLAHKFPPAFTDLLMHA